MSSRIWIEPDYERVLRNAGLVDFDTIMSRRGDGRALSSHHNRETVPLVLSIDDRPRQFFLKRMFRVERKHVVEDVLLRRWPLVQPRREWEIIGRLERAGIPAMKRVAAGERRRFGFPRAGFLLVEGVDTKYTVADWLGLDSIVTPPLSPDARRGLFAELGRVLGRLFATGLTWPDARPRHVFAWQLSTGTWQLRLIDIERIHRRTPWRSDPSCEFERWLHRCLPYEPSRTERAAFLEAFTRDINSPDCAARCDRFPMPAHDRVIPLRRPAHADASRMILNGQADGVWMDPREAARLRAIGLATPERLLEGAVGDSLAKPGLRGHRQRFRITSGANEPIFFLKRFIQPPATEQVRRCLSGDWFKSAAWREYRAMRRLAGAGIPTMRCVALAMKMQGIWERRSALVTAPVPGESLERWLPVNWPMADSVRRRAVISQVAAVARIMHAAQLFHRDFYLSHLFVSWTLPGEPVIHVIDVGRLLEAPHRPHRWRVKDIAALNYSAPRKLVSRTDRLRFLRMYLPGYDAPVMRTQRHRVYREWIAAVAARTSRTERRDKKAGRT